MFSRLKQIICSLFIFCYPLNLLAAGFGIDATRIIYPEDASSVNVTVRNTLTAGPYLVQSSVSSKQDEKASAPFNVTPPLFRLEPQSTNQLRIAFTGTQLPGDRESVFYLHASAIPSSEINDKLQSKGGVQAQLKFGVGSIIKLFYRPADLSGSSDDAQKGLRFSYNAGELKVTNPSPYFVSFSSLTFGGQKLPLDSSAARMLVPFGSHTWSVKSKPVKGRRIEWQTINDLGGHNAFNTALPSQ